MNNKNLFFEDEEILNDIKKEDRKVIKKTQKEVEEELKKKAFRKRKIKKSVFQNIDKKILEDIAKLIMTKQMSYRAALDQLKLIYTEDKGIQDLKRHESLRYYLIKKGFIRNEKALETINRNISNSEYAKSKRERIIKDVMKELLENIDKLLDNDIFIDKLLDNEEFINKLKKKLNY